MRISVVRSLFWAAAVLVMLAADARPQSGSATSGADANYEKLLAHPLVINGLAAIEADAPRTLEEQKRITEIPAPPFKEKLRAEYYLKRFQELGLKDAAIDAEGNVIALRKGTGGGPKLVVSAHLDTVFP